MILAFLNINFLNYLFFLFVFLIRLHRQSVRCFATRCLGLGVSHLLGTQLAAATDSLTGYLEQTKRMQVLPLDPLPLFEVVPVSTCSPLI